MLIPFALQRFAVLSEGSFTNSHLHLIFCRLNLLRAHAGEILSEPQHRNAEYKKVGHIEEHSPLCPTVAKQQGQRDQVNAQGDVPSISYRWMAMI